ncbi:MAG: hypothetical protein QGI18_08395 [Candidatus Marinimicrobia bacterium]|jgi:hypothetical protein|nr:hypothetical protein [Candidatus Neomarinimicrobiota bacterium]
MSIEEGSTFAGKNTEDTIENYAEVMLDNIKRGMLAEAIKAWEKAKEIDIRVTNKIFEGPYSSKIAHAYAAHVREKLIIPLEIEVVGSLHKRDNMEFGEIDIPDLRVGPIASVMTEAEVAFANAEAFNSAEYEIWIAKAEYYLAYLGPTMPFEHADGKKSVMEHWNEEEFNKKKEEGIKAAQMAIKLAPNDPASTEVLSKLNQRNYTNVTPCFIATAAHGTPFNEDIDVLRTWRDKFLMNSFGGKIFVKNYYRYSPPVANLISVSPTARKIVRNALKPVVKVLEDDYS